MNGERLHCPRPLVLRSVPLYTRVSEAVQLALQYVHVYSKTLVRVSFALKVPLVSFSIEREDRLYGTTGIQVVDECLIHCTPQLLSGVAVSLGKEKSFKVSEKAYRGEPGCREDNFVSHYKCGRVV